MSHRMVERKRTRRINKLLDQLKEQVEVGSHSPVSTGERGPHAPVRPFSPSLSLSPLSHTHTHTHAHKVSGRPCKKDKGGILSATIALIADLRKTVAHEEAMLEDRGGVLPPSSISSRARRSARDAASTTLPEHMRHAKPELLVSTMGTAIGRGPGLGGISSTASLYGTSVTPRTVSAASTLTIMSHSRHDPLTIMSADHVALSAARGAGTRGWVPPHTANGARRGTDV